MGWVERSDAKTLVDVVEAMANYAKRCQAMPSDAKHANIPLHFDYKTRLNFATLPLNSINRTLCWLQITTKPFGDHLQGIYGRKKWFRVEVFINKTNSIEIFMNSVCCMSVGAVLTGYLSSMLTKIETDHLVLCGLAAHHTSLLWLLDYTIARLDSFRDIFIHNHKYLEMGSQKTNLHFSRNILLTDELRMSLVWLWMATLLIWESLRQILINEW